MILHFSIPAENPQHVAQVLAEILHGQFAPFPFNPGSYIVSPFDEHGTHIEVFPLGTELAPGNGDEEYIYVQNPSASRFTATHAAISVPTSVEQIEQIAAHEGWRMRRRHFGDEVGFDWIEFWVENRLLLDFATSEMTAQYVAFVQPENLKKLLVFTGSAAATT